MATTNKPPAVPAADLGAIRDRLRTAREKTGLSPEAAAAGLSRSAVRNLEGGFANPALGTLFTLAGLYECPPAELLGGRPPAGKKY